MGVEVGVDLRLKPLGKPNSLHEVGEVGVVQQVGKVRTEQKDKRRIR